MSYGCLCAREIDFWPGREIAVFAVCVWVECLNSRYETLTVVSELEVFLCSKLFLVGWFLDLKTVGKKMVKLHVNACQVRKQVTVC